MEDKVRQQEQSKKEEADRQAEIQRQERLAAQAAAERQAELERKASEEAEEARWVVAWIDRLKEIWKQSFSFKTCWRGSSRWRKAHCWWSQGSWVRWDKKN